MIVIDASLAMEIVIRTPFGKRETDRIVSEDIHVPHLIDIEVANALRRLTLAGELDRSIAEDALRGMKDWNLERYGHSNLLDRIWELRNSVSAYDASYVALAETLGVPLLTCDAKLSRSHGHRANIVLLS